MRTVEVPVAMPVPVPEQFVTPLPVCRPPVEATWGDVALTVQQCQAIIRRANRDRASVGSITTD